MLNWLKSQVWWEFFFLPFLFKGKCWKLNNQLRYYVETVGVEYVEPINKRETITQPQWKRFMTCCIHLSQPSNTLSFYNQWIAHAHPRACLPFHIPWHHGGDKSDVQCAWIACWFGPVLTFICLALEETHLISLSWKMALVQRGNESWGELEGKWEQTDCEEKRRIMSA